MTRVRLAAAFALTLVLAGCLDATEGFYEFDPDEHYRNPGVFPGDYRSGDGGSLALVRGELAPNDPEVVRLVSDLPAYGELAGVMGADAQVDITMAIWRPMNHSEPVPVIVDAGPYFEQGCRIQPPPSGCPPEQLRRIDDPSQTTPFNLANFLPSGYAVVQLAVRGTGTSGGCMDLMGPKEQHDLDQAITWLGEQEWSNGRIAMVGASYDGSTPWVVAATGNPYLKTIVPTSGLPDFYDLMFRNGSSETRGAVMHNSVYWGFGFDKDFPQRPDDWPAEVPWLPPAASTLPPALGPSPNANGRQDYQDRQNLVCPEIAEASVLGRYSEIDGGRGDAVSSYWQERDHRPGVLENYDGSVFLVHGLQDWNVDPHVAIPFNQQLREAEIEMKEWYGQWGHAFPDSTCSPDAPDWVVLPCRLDFAENLRRWFDHYLKGDETLELGPSVQVQDHLGFWRNAESYPPEDPDWLELRLSADGRLAAADGTSAEVVLPPPGPDGPGEAVAFVSDPLPQDLHVSGLPPLRVPFEVDGQGGHIAAWLFEQDPDGLVRAPAAAPQPRGDNQTAWQPVGPPLVGHTQMNLRYHAGGDEPQPLQPGTRYVARMQFEPLELRVPEGHRLVLWLFQHHYPDRQDSATPAAVTLHLDDGAELRLPTVDVDARSVFPAPGAQFLNRTYVPQMYVPMPGVPAALAPPAVLDGTAETGPTPAVPAPAWADLGPKPGGSGPASTEPGPTSVDSGPTAASPVPTDPDRTARAATPPAWAPEAR